MNRHVLPIQQDHRAAPAAIDFRKCEPFAGRAGVVDAPIGAPNVLVVVLDDMGFGAPSPFGGPCEMPTADRLARGGLRYTRFHTTAMCSPTRAALLTGRNHHTCEMGAIPDLATQAPGYTGVRPKEVATIARILQANGYATGAFGKMHQTPPWETTAIGPFDRWPTHEGFDKFYGFLGAETNQFTPNLIDGVTPIPPPRTVDEGYHLSEDLADQAIAWITSVRSLDARKPWFCYLSYGACHAPFQVPESWRHRYRGRFSHGWDVQRQRTLAAQKESGVVPRDATLAPWPEEIPSWDDLTEVQRAVGERLMESYAAFAEHTDVQTGRVVDALTTLGAADNTLIIYLLGDNGASAEGGFEGSANENLGTNGVTDTAERIYPDLDLIGGPYSYPHYPSGWALAMNTPYQWAKTVASHYGGTRNGLIVHWPKGIPQGGQLRHQWHHCVDIAPTILEVSGLPEPSVVDGAAQIPMEGTSLAYTFTEPDAADRHRTQYFEIFGNRGIYHEGWTAVTKHRNLWSNLGSASLPPFDDDTWELYDSTADWTQATDLAKSCPEKLRELQELFLVEAARRQVFPLDDRFNERHDPAVAGRMARREITLTGGAPGLREPCAPNVKNTSFRVRAEIEVRDPAAGGVIVAQGGRFGGWSIYIHHGRLRYCHNFCGLERTYIDSDTVLTPGVLEVEFGFSYDGGGVGKGGCGAFRVNGKPAGSGRLERTTAYLFSLDETLDVGLDRGTPVTEEYDAYPGNGLAGAVRLVHLALEDDTVELSPRDTVEVAARGH